MKINKNCLDFRVYEFFDTKIWLNKFLSLNQARNYNLKFFYNGFNGFFQEDKCNVYVKKKCL